MSFILLFFAGGVAWFISTIAAGGAATLLVPVIGFILGTQFVAPIISVASLCTNPTRSFLFRAHVDWRVLRFLLPGTLIGSALGAWSFSFLDPQLIQLVMALFLLTYVFQDHFSKARVTFKTKVWWFLPLGGLVSFLSGMVGATGPLLNPFLLSYGLQKEELIGTKSINSLLMQFTKLTTYTLFGSLTGIVFLYGVVIGVGAIVGVFLARRHLFNIEVERFRGYTLTMMLIAGILMLFDLIKSQS